MQLNSTVNRVTLTKNTWPEMQLQKLMDPMKTVHLPRPNQTTLAQSDGFFRSLCFTKLWIVYTIQP